MNLPESVYVFAKIVTALFIVLDPLALVPLVVGLQARMPARAARNLVLKVVGGATVLLLFFIATGTGVLGLFGVTLSDLRIAGGLLLLIISLRMVVEGRLGPSGEEGYNAIAVPLISPLLVGPGAITASVVLAGIHGIAKTACAAVVAMALSLVVLLSSRQIHRLIGDSGADMFTRLMGMLIAAIAISYIRSGVINIVAAWK
jgi:multiple antibiotic resistance protein